ncbi:MAG: hypothetical protein OXC63_00845 [Aestuariivita sp.]|nr:hypothetical protein [Aestuariivita sp.]MCY4345766.1 hypothetical protein [Aestuariivita sp.]
MKYFKFLLPFVGVLLGATVTISQQADEEMLLSQLSQADSEAAIRIDRELQSIWSKTGSSAMDVLMRRGQDALESQDYRQAIEHFTALTDHAPDFAAGWHLRATAFLRLDLLGPAVADLEHALALNPSNYHAIFSLANVLEQLDKLPEAHEAYSIIAMIHPHFAGVDDALSRTELRLKGSSL